MKIECNICGAHVHSIRHHLKSDHTDWNIQRYQSEFPGAPTLSDEAKEAMARRREEQAAAAAAAAAPGEVAPAIAMAGAAAATVTKLVPRDTIVPRPLHEVFGLAGKSAATGLSESGRPVPISTIANASDEDMVPEANDTYVFNVDELKNAILAIELRMPLYVWGHKGSGKTELMEQICARTGRPFVRIQHTVNTEESHIVGQYIVKANETVFELGLLPLAMKNGWVFCADEYDFAMPSVLSAYQAVLEGKPLVIKEADHANRVIKPHPNFRFVATGNTNGSGDESGLYQGTLLQNSANYDRFGMVVHKQYMEKGAESQILQRHLGLEKEDADKMVEFATMVREAFDGGKISDVISPRTLISASKIALKRGSFRKGIDLSFIAKLSKVDREVVGGLAQRVFGSK